MLIFFANSGFGPESGVQPEATKEMYWFWRRYRQRRRQHWRQTTVILDHLHLAHKGKAKMADEDILGLVYVHVQNKCERLNLFFGEKKIVCCFLEKRRRTLKWVTAKPMMCTRELIVFWRISWLGVCFVKSVTFWKVKNGGDAIGKEVPKSSRAFPNPKFSHASISWISNSRNQLSSFEALNSSTSCFID